MPRVTALRRRGPGRVAVELDGAVWRTFPHEVVARAMLSVGLELDRPRLRVLRRALRRHEALRAATGALRWRDLSERALGELLARAGVAPVEREEAVSTLSRTGLVDDERFAQARARVLAERGFADAAIRHDLDVRGLARERVEEALAELPPETERAARIAAERGDGLRTARHLARRGFRPESIEAAVSGLVAEEP